MLRKPWRRCRSTLANLKMTELEILGINFVCVLSALSDAKIPEKECLLPLVSKLLGYCIVAASTTVKLPQDNEMLKRHSESMRLQCNCTIPLNIT
ncbi:mannose-P-dolichol utilization defect 1 protein homolog 2 isoform X3 [Triticum aestivum]|uniref:mannose-P-dolichol utilization defect 1 protein homolog 2 isoform X3 n=1 Tax=Triticum aestivum TaxID=4565 RepID=UPI001D004BF7|nr:mannose-P-dolichol utilization defect 1 protein homolog 2-like isoform X3 [Triticum aestivum]